VDTDRLPEEKARGISIDLGFAYWTVEGKTIGFVDVPGHERFVRNMLAGVAAIDFALLVIAADDGVMPQSVEHVQILDLLGVSRGMVAITKCDRVGPERVAEVRGQIAALLAPTVLAGAPMFEVSALSGAGMPALAAALTEASRNEPERAAPGRNFRLAIDRVFSVPGTGTVVTGTAQDGALETGAHLNLSSNGRDVRVRGMQSGSQEVTRVEPGQRCALNLAGAEVADIKRGDWLLVPGMFAPSRRLEARLRLLPGEGAALKHNTAVHLHLGTADVVGRVLLPAQQPLAPGQSALVQLLLDHPVCTAVGDRFIVRDQSARRSLGGGRVIDPQVQSGRREQSLRAAQAAALELLDPAQALAAAMRFLPRVRMLLGLVAAADQEPSLREAVSRLVDHVRQSIAQLLSHLGYAPEAPQVLVFHAAIVGLAVMNLGRQSPQSEAELAVGLRQLLALLPHPTAPGSPAP